MGALILSILLAGNDTGTVFYVWGNEGGLTCNQRVCHGSACMRGRESEFLPERIPVRSRPACAFHLESSYDHTSGYRVVGPDLVHENSVLDEYRMRLRR